MKKLLISCILSQLFILSASAPAAVIFVDSVAAGANNGSSWADAYTDLQNALDDADPCDDIWVAQGTYYPTSDYGLNIGFHGRHFRMINGVAIYGGFPNTGNPNWLDRKPSAYVTILSSDWLDNDNPNTPVEDLHSDPCRVDNNYHVFYHPQGLALEPNAVLDGFTITGGNANGSYPHYYGGGMCNDGSNPTVTNCTFTGNSAMYGGGMYNHLSTSPIVTNCIFVRNLADDRGGGMYNYYSSYTTVTGCIFTENWALGGGGMFNRDTPTITSSIFWGNNASDSNEIGNSSNYPIISYCDIEGSLVGGTWDANLGIDGGGNIDVDPLFINPAGADNIAGTDDDNLRLLPGSPCIDAGDPCYILDHNNPTDIDGRPRIADGDGDSVPIVDMGPYEMRVIHVDANASGGTDDGTTWANAFDDLQKALDIATTGDRLWVAEGTYKPSVEVGGSGSRYKTFQMINGVDIYGGFPNSGDPNLFDRDPNTFPAILSGDLLGNDNPNTPTKDLLNDPCRTDNSYHVFCHPNDLNLDATAILDGFTITSGNTDYSSSPHYYGAGMFNEGCSPTVTDCIFSDNSAVYDGGISNNNSNPNVTGCTFAGNSSDNSGGGMGNNNSNPNVIACKFTANSAYIYGGGMSNSASSPKVTDCIFSGNLSDHGGGGMGNNNSNPNVTDCIFSQNWADDDGGGMHNYNSNPTVTGCLFTGNLVEDRGAGMDNYNSSPTVTGCTFTANWAKLEGGGMHNLGSPIVKNCILWGNIASLDGNEIYGATSVSYCCVQGGHTGTGNLDTDPCFVSPDTNDFRLLFSSPCIDAGDPNFLLDPNYPTDLDGRARIADGDCDANSIVDMGAYEFNWAYVGDFDGGCDVDLLDFAIFQNAFLTTPADDNYNPACDIALPADSLIDWLDLATFANHWLHRAN
jgi:hypothetical protein